MLEHQKPTNLVTATLTLTREQVACILAHAFLCSYDRTSPVNVIITHS